MSEHPRTDLTETDLRRRVLDIVAEISRIDPEDFEDDVLIREELGIDSLQAMEIVAACEKALGISIDEGQLFCVQTVGDFLLLVETLYRSGGESV
ncbi:MAG: acyl carrier protein [Spirochaetaceae bacterium]